MLSTNPPLLSESKIRAISSLLNLCERATISIQREGISNAVKAIMIICMKYVDKESLFKAVLPEVYIDWDYVKGQSLLPTGAASSSMTLKKNLLGDCSTWLHVMQFIDFGEPRLPDRQLQKQYPPLYCMHSAVAAAGEAFIIVHVLSPF